MNTDTETSIRPLKGFTVEVRDTHFTEGKKALRLKDTEQAITGEWGGLALLLKPKRLSGGEVPSVFETNPLNELLSHYLPFEGAQALAHTFIAQFHDFPGLECRIVQHSLEIKVTRTVDGVLDMPLIRQDPTDIPSVEPSF